VERLRGRELEKWKRGESGKNLEDSGLITSEVKMIGRIHGAVWWKAEEKGERVF